MKKLAILLLLTMTTVTAFAQNQTLRCSGTNQASKVAENLFYYDGQTIMMIGKGTQDMYVPLVNVSGKNRAFENNKYFITISAKGTVTIEMKGIARDVYSNVRCDSTAE